MTIAQKLTPFIDVDIAKKAFIFLSGFTLSLIPIQAVYIYHSKSPSSVTKSSLPENFDLDLEQQSTYIKTFDQGTLFGGPALAPGSSQVLLSSAADLVKDYRLLGVVLGGTAEAIVEDARTQKTNFVKVGERVGELTVKEISEGFVVLDYLNNEVKLQIQ